MDYLSLYSGGGGGDLAMQHMLGHRCLGYVEFEEYCQKILKQRMIDGIFSKAPIFGDIRAFVSEGWAEQYKGMVDLITGGFPCQPFSVAGKGLGEDDPRNMWPATRDTISIIRPRFAFLENVPGLLAHGYTRQIFGELAEMGYDCRWGVVGADNVGAPHRRKRLWILADSASNIERKTRPKLPQDTRQNGSMANATAVRSGGGGSKKCGVQGWELEQSKQKGSEIRGEAEGCGGKSADLANSSKQGPQGSQQPETLSGDRDGTKAHGSTTQRSNTWWNQDPADLGDSERVRELQPEGGESDKRGRVSYSSPVKAGLPNTTNIHAQGCIDRSGEVKSGRSDKRKGEDDKNGATQPRLGRVAHGVAYRNDFPGTPFTSPIPRVASGIRDRVSRLKGIGNGQVSATAALAVRILTKEY